MISNEKYTEILSSGLLLDHYFLLCSIKSGVKPVQNKRIQGFTNLLIKKGYIEDDKLTVKGIELIDDIELETEASKSTGDTSFNAWVVGLHQRCQAKLKELTGKIQVRDKINNTPYSFLPNPIDLGKNLYKVITAYKTKDYVKLEKCIMNHIQSRYEAKSWFPILEYYIMKSGKSKLVTDYENFSEEDTSKANLPGTKFL